MPQIIVVRPTKIELIRLRRRLSLASRIQKIVKDRLAILMMEFLQIARETAEARRKMLGEFSEAYKALSIAAGYHGYMSSLASLRDDLPAYSAAYLGAGKSIRRLATLACEIQSVSGMPYAPFALDQEEIREVETGRLNLLKGLVM